jgi:DNA-binding CsgD family transcriptional regulator
MSEKFGADNIGDLIATIGTPAFGPQFFDLFQDALQIDHCTVFAFKGTARPNSVVLEARSAELSRLTSRLAKEYIAGAFTDDPNVRRDRSYETPTVHCLRADELKNRGYRSRFYDEPGMAHELVVLGQNADTLYYSSFYRTGTRPGFEKGDINLASELAQFSLKTLHRHFALLGAAEAAPSPWMTGASSATLMSPAQRKAMLGHLTEVLLGEPHTLSAREAQICAAIILGYTTFGISMNFGISINTVATHRKRAYRKLGICSQNELFSRYFQAANQHNWEVPRATRPC